MTFQIIIAVGVSLVVVLALVTLLLWAKAKLTVSGKVTIDINEGERTIEVESGSSLLTYRNYYYRHRDEILAKKAAERVECVEYRSWRVAVLFYQLRLGSLRAVSKRSIGGSVVRPK